MKLSSNKFIIDPPKVTWVLAANRVGAVIFRKVKGAHLEFLERYENPTGRLREQELASDSPGKVKTNAFSGHGLGQQNLLHEQAALRFAKRLARQVNMAKEEGRFDDLVLIAEPRFLGFLRTAFAKKLERLQPKTINREIKFIDTKRIEKRVTNLLRTGLSA